MFFGFSEPILAKITFYVVSTLNLFCKQLFKEKRDFVENVEKFAKRLKKERKNMAGVDDGGRCLMDEINALFAPPGRGDAKKRAETASKTELHPYYKRPGL